VRIEHVQPLTSAWDDIVRRPGRSSANRFSTANTVSTTTYAHTYPQTTKRQRHRPTTDWRHYFPATSRPTWSIALWSVFGQQSTRWSGRVGSGRLEASRSEPPFDLYIRMTWSVATIAIQCWFIIITVVRTALSECLSACKITQQEDRLSQRDLASSKWIICGWINAPFWNIRLYKVLWSYHPG